MRLFPRPVRTVIFDGECGFCRRAVRLGRRLDWLHLIDWRARREPGLLEQFPQLSGEDTRQRMVSIRRDGTTYGGFYAVRDIARFLPLTTGPSLLLHLPGAAWLGVPLYHWIATHRHQLGGGSDTSCDIGP